jgi:hypothetical protein
MKRLIITTLAILITGNALANTQSSTLNKNSEQLKRLGAAFKHHPTVAPKIDPSDITMGYAGQDVAGRTPVIVF